MDKEEIKDYLVNVAEKTEDEVNEMTDFELVDSFLCWNGIIGWTEDIINVVFGAYEINKEVF